MAKTTLQEFEGSLQDPLLSDNYKVIIPTPQSMQGADNKPMSIQIKSAAKPGMNIEQQLTEVFGHALRYAGRKTFTGTWSVNYQESADLKITNFIEAWVNSIRGTDTQIGSNKDEYAVKVTFQILDNKDQVVASYDIHGVWPTAVPELPMEQSGQALEISAEFSFDYYEPTP